MQELVPIVWLAVAAVAGLILGALVLYLAARRWTAQAHASGRASRDAEIAILAEQREAAATRGEEMAERIQRYERDWAAAEQNLRKLTAHAAAQQTQAEQIGHQLADARRGRDDAQARLVELTRAHAALEAGAREQAQAAADKLQLLEQAEHRLREAFQNLANQILDDKAERFREQSSQQLGGLLDPLKLQLKEFRETIHTTHATEQRERGMLAQEIQTLKQLNQRISEDAINLTRALKGDTRSQGAWGELVLERVLEASGLRAGREYETQASFSDGDGGRQRPDVIVHLPEDKDIVIDAKMSLVAYERFVAAVDDGERATALTEHVTSLRRHIDNLSGKNYREIAGLRTLDFVLLFVPVEAAFIEAMRADDRLYSHALSKNISLVSPSTLLATLRTIAHLWRIERRNAKADEIARRAANLHDNFALLVDELEAIGSQLDKAQRAHASALRRLTEGGRGSVLLQVKSLAEIAPVKKELPTSLLDAASAEESTAGAEKGPAE
ncbi:DNA recombination protein RmuC [Dokdonella sp.]|uniref:DNA recombination protein RmuC n=1 Tax=Dokdonella sp. TaxID=2291710 RepID=UPI001B2D7601|nr:DNA recombination protein RmuC [Dokdonella sp.]MBO9664129.1 DNA recombination protein RmuC [Dokdonella sp.]